MRILADENIPRIIVEALNNRGHDVLWIAEVSPAISDSTVIQLSISQHRLILTFDLDFGELIFRQRYRAPDGVILFRIPILPPDEMAQFVIHILASREDWSQHFSVIEEKAIRMVHLPE